MPGPQAGTNLGKDLGKATVARTDGGCGVRWSGAGVESPNRDGFIGEKFEFYSRYSRKPL